MSTAAKEEEDPDTTSKTRGGKICPDLCRWRRRGEG
jgi:hypothetical protein